MTFETAMQSLKASYRKHLFINENGQIIFKCMNVSPVKRITTSNGFTKLSRRDAKCPTELEIVSTFGILISLLK